MGIHYNTGASTGLGKQRGLQMVGGFFKPLTKPGLGVEIDEAKVIEFSKMPRTGVIRSGVMKITA